MRCLKQRWFEYWIQLRITSYRPSLKIRFCTTPATSAEITSLCSRSSSTSTHVRGQLINKATLVSIATRSTWPTTNAHGAMSALQQSSSLYMTGSVYQYTRLNNNHIKKRTKISSIARWILSKERSRDKNNKNYSIFSSRTWMAKGKFMIKNKN